MKSPDLNLATRPFVNRRPVSRLAWGLWIFGVLLLVVNFNAYRKYFSGSDEKVAEIQALDAKIVNHETAIRELKASLLSMDLIQQNEQVDFLNRKIAERTFSWSHLFDQLEDVLPDDVRISNLTPKVTEVSRTRRATEANELLGDRVAMSIVAVAKTVDAQLDFVDGFFQHPSFEQPRLSSDSQADGSSRFNLSVIYLPVRSSSDQLAESPAADDPNAEGPSVESRAMASTGSRGSTEDRRPALAAAASGGPPLLAVRPNDRSRTPQLPPSAGSVGDPDAPPSTPQGSESGVSGAPRSTGTGTGTGGRARGGSFGVPGTTPGASSGSSTPSAPASGRSGTATGGGTGQRQDTGAGTTESGDSAPSTPGPSDDDVRPSGRIPSASSSLEPQ